MKKLFVYALIAVGLVYIYFWYVRGINLLLAEDDGVYLPPYTQFAVRIPVPDVAEDGIGAVWSSGVPMPTPRTDVAAAAIGEMVYVVGGVDSFARTVATVEAFNTSNNTWIEVADLPTALHHVALAVYDNKLFVLGGLEGLSMSPSSAAYVFDPTVGSWKDIKQLLSATGAAAAVVHQDKIHLLGGIAAGGVTPTHMIYDPQSKEWSWGEEMLTARSNHGAASLDGFLVVFGGRTGSVAYNIDTTDALADGETEWTRWQPMSIKRSGFGTAQFGGKVYAFGGEAPTTTMSQVEALDAESKTWKLMPTMPTARQGMGAAVVGGRIFVIGGGKHPGVSVSDINEVFMPAGYVKAEDES